MAETQDDLKAQAAKTAVELIQSGMVVGLGHGTTVEYAVNELADHLAGGKLKDIVTVVCSRQTESQVLRLGMPLVDLNDRPVIDLTIDGADEVDPALNLIKGGGGALMREKIVAQASKREVIIVDESKLSQVLGTKRSVPLEVSPFGWKSQQAFIASMGYLANLRRSKEDQPVLTDQGNYLLNCEFGPIDDAVALAQSLELRAGILEHGLFLGLATDVIVAGEKGLQHLKRD